MGPTQLRGADLFVDDDTSPHDQLLAWESTGRAGDANLIRAIADQPLATWLSHDPTTAEAEAHELVTRAHEAAKLPVVVVYNLPQRDCGGHSAGGAASAAASSAAAGRAAATIMMTPNAADHAVDSLSRCPPIIA